MASMVWGGCDTVALAQEFGTPLYVMDENDIRSRCRRLVAAVKGRNARVCYAGKAFFNLAMARIAAEEGLDVDIVSEGELYIAHKAGFPMERAILHGNAKTEEFLSLGLKWHAGTVVVDSEDELALLERLCEKENTRQKILLRANPGIDAHTNTKIDTAQMDCKFGIPIAHIDRTVEKALKSKCLDLVGLHVNVGSQLQDTEAHMMAVDCMTGVISDLRNSLGFVARELDLGGGFGIPLMPEEPSIPADAFIGDMLDRVDERCAKLGIARPVIIFEPGRWVVGEAGITLYTIQSIKTIPGVRTYVSVDGGMTDNPRPQLYQAEYAVKLANDVDRPITKRAAIAGPCCESGDLITKDTPVPELHVGEVLAVPLTGAYNYSMFSTYNCTRRPAVVFVKDGHAKVVVKRQSYEDLIAGQI